MPTRQEPTQLTIFTDGGSRGNPGNAGGGVYVVDQAAQPVLNLGLFFGHKTNNEAEYLAFLSALKWLQRQFKDDDTAVVSTAQLATIKIILDSKLVVEQINKNWKIKEARLQQLATSCWQILAKIPCKITIKHAARENNCQADALANLAMDVSV